MAEDRTIARCSVDHLEDGPSGPGFYYSLTDAAGNETDPIGPYESVGEAETAFMDAMEQATVDLIIKTLGLES